MNTFAELCNEVITSQRDRIQELEGKNQKLREQRDAANAVIQELNRIIAGDTE